MLPTTIYTYGYFDAMYHVINALAMFRNAEFYTVLVNFVALLTGCYYAMRIAGNHASYRVYMYRLLSMIAIINALLLPKTSMQIKDQISKKITRVDNIPVAFAVPVGVLENFGYLITRGFEQAFSTPGSFDYFNYGMQFGARLKKEIKELRIKNPEFVGNMSKFMRTCVAIPAQIGYQFTKEQLMSTDNMWKLVKEKAGTLTMIDMNTGSSITRMNCKDAAAYFEANA